MHMLRSVQIAIIFAAGCELQHRFAPREEKKFRDMAEAYFRILDEDLEDDICDTTIKSQLRYAWGSKDKSSMTGDTLWRKWQEIRNKLRNSIICTNFQVDKV